MMEIKIYERMLIDRHKCLFDDKFVNIDIRSSYPVFYNSFETIKHHRRQFLLIFYSEISII